MKVDAREVEWLGDKHLELNCRCFRFDGDYYKALLPAALPHMLTDDFDSLLHSMWANGFLARTERVDMKMEGFCKIYKQESELFNVHCRYYIPEMLRTAALLYIDMNLWLHERGFMLQDGHSSNFILLGNSQSRWCDIGSIIPLKVESWGMNEFINWFVIPLILRSKNAFAGPLLHFFLGHGFNRLWLDLFPDIKEQAFPEGDLPQILLSLRETIKNLQFMYHETVWGSYKRPEVNDHLLPPENNRVAFFDRIVSALGPLKRIIDLGANSGFFSRRAANRSGAEILAVDDDETALSYFYMMLQHYEVPGPIKLMRCQVQDLELPEEQKADLVLALALTHHLYLGAGFRWQYIASKLASLSRGSLLTEFMPQGFGADADQGSLPADYSLAAFQKELGRYFKRIEAIDYPPVTKSAPRIFILCTGRLG